MAQEPLNIFVTGASGVLGQGLLPRLSDHRVIALRHESRVPSGQTAELVRGDMCEPRFGLTEARYRELAAEVDVVIHAAAAGTTFAYGLETITDVNRAGTTHALELAAAAGAPIYHVSTALLHGTRATDDTRTPIGEGFAEYRGSKAVAEDLVRASGVPHVILRPSLIGGDALTGEITKFQGMHALLGYIIGGDVAFVPMPANAHIDYIPRDVLADAIARLIESSVTDGMYWVTAGPEALRMGEVIPLAVEFAHSIGRDVKTPRFVDPEIVDRLLRPVFMDEVPRRLRSRIDRMLEFTHIIVPDGKPIPTSLPALQERFGVMALPDMREVTWHAMEFWAMRKGLVQRATA